jgi:hypothetical protein
MRIYPSFITSLLALFFLFSACSIERHHYTGGFHFNRSPIKKFAQVRTTKQTHSAPEEFSILTSGESTDAQPVEEAPIASSEHFYSELNTQREVRSLRSGRMNIHSNQPLRKDTIYVQQPDINWRLSNETKQVKIAFLTSLISGFTIFTLFMLKLYTALTITLAPWLFLSIIAIICSLFVASFFYHSLKMSKLEEAMSNEIVSPEVEKNYEKLKKWVLRFKLLSLGILLLAFLLILIAEFGYSI